MRKLFLYATSILLFFITQSIAHATIYYVDDHAHGAGGGLSWENAFRHPQDAIDAASPGDQIWVADGYYYPKNEKSSAVIHMKDGVDIYGGFSGISSYPPVKETRLHQRSLGYLSELDADGKYDSPNVVIGADNARLDGFTIRTGGASSDGWGMINDGVSPVIENCKISGGVKNIGYHGSIKNCEFSSKDGIAITNYNSSPNITNCNFNKTSGAIDNDSSSPIISNCSFRENGVAVNNHNSSYPNITKSIFVANRIAIVNDRSSSAVHNCIFAGNNAVNMQDAVIVNTNGSFPSISNCTFIGNKGSQYYVTARGIRSDSTSTPKVINSIFWRNQPERVIEGPATVIYSNVQGGYKGDGNINSDPKFMDPGYWDDNGTPGSYGDDTWVEGDYHLQSNSPCIDSGTASGVPDEDLEGIPRPQGPGYDMGSYEFSSEVADLYISKIASDDIVQRDESLTLTIDVGNNGPGDTAGIMVRDEFPPYIILLSTIASQGTCRAYDSEVNCELGTLMHNNYATVTLEIIPFYSGLLTNTASVSSIVSDPELKNNTSTVSTTVVPPPEGPVADLGFVENRIYEVACSPDRSQKVFKCSEKAEVKNNGPDAATDIVLTCIISPDLDNSSVRTTHGSCRLQNPVICDLGTLSGGEIATITISGQAENKDDHFNELDVTSSVFDPDLSNNTERIVMNTFCYPGSCFGDDDSSGCSITNSKIYIISAIGSFGFLIGTLFWCAFRRKYKRNTE